MKESIKEMLDIFERFGDRAQDALEFAKRNEAFAHSKDGDRPAPVDGQAPCKESQATLEDGVYVIYKDGTFARFTSGIIKDEGMRVGISWHGSRWVIGTDYGDKPWSKATDEELEANTYGIMSEWEALFDWDYMEAKRQLGDLWKHIPFKDNESMPTAPMVLVQEFMATRGPLNEALRFCNLPEYEVGVTRWFVERSNVNYARVFDGAGGYLGNYGVGYRYRTQAVTPW